MRMRKPMLYGFRLIGAFTTTAGAICVLASDARAQAIDENPPLPNVLLLLDTSGSMERMIDGTLPEASPSSTCTPGTQTVPNRWGVALQALTGDIQPYYSCVSQSRSSTTFTEYNIAGQAPYDSNYFLPFHRPVSWVSPLAGGAATSCVYAPGSLPGAPAGQGVGPVGSAISGSLATDFPAAAIVQRLYGTTSTTNTCAFQQLNNGAISTASAIMRFGLMTFDADTLAGTGVSTGSNLTVNTVAPFGGMWSYFPGWDGNGTSTPASGNLPACVSNFWEVGAKNPAAPPWEGRLIAFPSPTASAGAVQSNNGLVQTSVSALRPYGATPIAGMLTDSQYYFVADPKGPYKTDVYVQGGCRSQYQILLTDGAPNMDMRTPCQAGVCPYQLPEQVASTLYNGTVGQKVTTFVIGFAVSSVNDQGTLVQCQNLISNGTLAAVCSNPPTIYQACCNLEKIALNGGSQHAYFADTPGALTQALSDIMAKISSQTTTRTVPAYSGFVNPSTDPNNPTPQAATFLSAFNPGIGKPWSGDIQREQQICQLSGGKFTVPAPVVNYANGDDFASNIDSHKGALVRSFFAVQPGNGSGTIDASATIRPYVSSTPVDNLGNYGGTQYGPTLATILTNITPAALNISATQPQCANNANTKWLSKSDCEALAFNFLFGQASSAPLQTNPPPPANPLPADANGFAPFHSRYCQTGCTTGTPDVSAFGDIFHATPTVQGAPTALLRDESYALFSAQNQSRKNIVYAATNDGLLHAFWADIAKQENNELWALVPPGVMQGLISQYPSTHNFLLDGAPVVKDVVFTRSAGAAGSSATISASFFHTMLVASYGSQGRGFYAVDVTTPDPTTTPAGKPVFRWQLTNMPGGAFNIFGIHSATPAITTVFANPDGTGTREIGVAILPGGADTGPTSGGSLGGPACARVGPVNGSNTATPLANSSGATFTARTSVRCWGQTQAQADAVVGRSVAVVRVDTGEILQVFMRKNDLPTTHPLRTATQSMVNDTPLDSPMTGTPVVYPADTGSVAQKVFISDADGTLWKFDLTSSDPTKWTGQMFLDTFNTTVDTGANAWQDGQPIQVSPVVSLDRTGSIVLSVATGDQESYTPTGTNYVYSLSEKIQGVSTPQLRAQVNWYQQLINGERASGPMAVFDGALYIATFKPAASTGCSAGTPTIWGMDFVTPSNTMDLSKGGAPRMLPGPTQYVDPTGGNPASPLAGKVIPGVSINVTPACADLSQTAGDQYAFGSSHTTASNVTSGSYSLLAQVGGKGVSGNTAVGTYSVQLPPPQTLTVVDSWAAVVE